MTARPVSAGQDSTGGSSVPELTIGVSKLAPLPEQWTLPQEWNIEKRETFDVSFSQTNTWLFLYAHFNKVASI